MKKTSIAIVVTAVISCGIMALIDGVIQPGYAVKSAVKLALFLGIPFILSRFDRSLSFAELFRFRKKGFAVAPGLGLGVYGLIVGGYFLVRNFFDFSGIAGKLTQNAGVTRDNFLFISLYISFINSLLEEFFFRGFQFVTLKKYTGAKFAHLFSSGLFALYHVAIMIGWFSPVLFILVMAGLTVGGMLFNIMNQRLGSIYPSWLTHMFANFAINTIGFMLMA